MVASGVWVSANLETKLCRKSCIRHSTFANFFAVRHARLLAARPARSKNGADGISEARMMKIGVCYQKWIRVNATEKHKFPRRMGQPAFHA
jgi:hypothetical protein